MGVLFGILMNFFVGLFGKVFLHAAFKIAITLAFITIVIAAVMAYVTAAKTLIDGISQTVPDVVAGVWGWVMPANTSSLFVVIFGVYLLRFFTKQYMLLLNWRFRAAISN